MARGEGKHHNGELLTTSGYLRAMRDSNFILTFSGGRLSYDTLPDELEMETRPSKHSGLEGGGGDKGRDVEGGAGGGPRVDPEERRRRKSCCFWFLYEWRKWKWKMKNRTILKHCMGDLKRNSDNVPKRLAHLIDEEVRLSTPVPSSSLFLSTELCVCVCCQIASIRYLKAKIAKLTAHISAIQANPEKHLPKTGVAFMVFDSMVVPRMTIQPFVAPHEMMISAAPEPNDVSWKTLHPPYWRLLLTRMVVIVGLILMAIAWAFPAFIFASTFQIGMLGMLILSTTECVADDTAPRLRRFGQFAIAGRRPGLWVDQDGHQRPLVRLRRVGGRGLRSGDLSRSVTRARQAHHPLDHPSVIRVLIAHSPRVTPAILAALTVRACVRVCSRWAKSTVEWKTMTTYWSFLIIHVVFVSTFGGTLSKILSEFIDNPRYLPHLA